MRKVKILIEEGIIDSFFVSFEGGSLSDCTVTASFQTTYGEEIVFYSMFPIEYETSTDNWSDREFILPVVLIKQLIGIGLALKGIATTHCNQAQKLLPSGKEAQCQEST